MTSVEMLQIAEGLGLGAKEFAHLMGLSARTVRRGVHDGGTVDLLLRAIKSKLEDPKSTQSIRALAITAARGEGLQHLMSRLLNAYAIVDLICLRQ